MKATKIFTLLCALILAASLLFSACGKVEVEGPEDNDAPASKEESVTDSESTDESTNASNGALTAAQWKSAFDLSSYKSLSIDLKTVENANSTKSTFKYKSGSTYVKHEITENGATTTDEFISPAKSADLKTVSPYVEELIAELEALEDFGFSLFTYSEEKKAYEAKIDLQIPQTEVSISFSGTNLSKITLNAKGKINAEATEETSISVTVELSEYDSTTLPTIESDTQESASESESNTETDDKKPETPPTDEEKYNEALALIAENNYSEAMEILSSLKSYTPAQEKLKNFFYAPRIATKRWKDSDNIVSGGINFTYSYDDMGNVLSILENDETTEYTYDAKGNRLTEKNPTEELAYTYTNGKLTKIAGAITVTTYEYNEKGQIAKVTVETDDGTDKYTEETVYEYTYYDNGNVKTMLKNNYFEYRYTESGVLEDVIGYSDYATKTAELSLTPKFENGKIASIEIQGIYGESISITYNYATNGNLSKVEALVYQDEELEMTYTFAFDEYILFYSENPDSYNEITKICHTDIDTIFNEVY